MPKQSKKPENMLSHTKTCDLCNSEDSSDCCIMYMTSLYNK